MATFRNSFLASVISQPRGSRIRGPDDFRIYRSAIRTSSTVGGNEDQRITSIKYEIGSGVPSIVAALRPPPENPVLIECAYPTAGSLVEDFLGLAKKYTNFSAEFMYTSHAAIVERLARALAATSVFGNIDSADIRAGRPLNVNALGTYDGPVNSLTTTVFIPRLVNSVLTGDVFTVLASAAAGEGASIATDIIELDAVTRQPIMPHVNPEGLPRAIVSALRLLGSNMIASDQGPLFALALTRGIHRVLSVVGHSDEGAVLRDVFRASHFSVPFGGIHYGLDTYAGIPALSSNSHSSVAAYVDGIALVTAGLVAHCDPGIEFDGRWYPTFYLGTGADDPTGVPGSHVEGTSVMADRNRAQLVANFDSFSKLYTKGLGKLFCAEGDPSRARSVFNALSTHLALDNRHLRHASVAPWFWVEPTSLLPHDFLGTPAEIEGFASYGGRDCTRTRPAFEDIVAATQGDVLTSSYHALFRTARTCWFLLHWLGNPQNGLGATSVRQLDPNGIIHPGGHDTYPLVHDRVMGGVPLSGLLWVRGQSPFPAPSECINLGGTMGFVVRHATIDDEGIPTVEHVPMAHEFLDCCVSISVGRPVSCFNGASNDFDSNTRRNRTRAARELNASSARASLYGTTGVNDMPSLTTAPVMRARPPAQMQRPPDDDTPGGIVSLRRSNVAAVPETNERGPVGNPVPAVPHYDAVRFPQVIRAMPTQPGGGSIAIPGVPLPRVNDDGNPEQSVAPDTGPNEPPDGEG